MRAHLYSYTRDVGKALCEYAHRAQAHEAWIEQGSNRTDMDVHLYSVDVNRDDRIR